MTGSPGSHDGRNWSPAETIDDYVRNCHEGLEEWSDRRAAKLLGCSRILLYRAQLMAQLPDDLFEALLKAHTRPSSRGFAKIVLALQRAQQTPEIERCPHCGRLVRIRGINAEHLAIVNKWLDGSG